MMTIFEFKRKVIYMQEIKIFEGHEVEVLEFEGQVLFNAKHVAEILDIKNVNDNISRMNEKQVIKLTNSAIGKTDIRKLNNAGENFLTESGVYKLVFKSHKPNAEKFTDWIADEVLPSIRKHGMYAVDELIANPELAIRAFTALKEEREKNKALQKDNERMKPKAEFFDAVTDSKDAIDMGQVAKVLNYPRIGRNKLFEILRDNGILQQNNQPYQKYIDCGYFRVIEQKYEARPGEIRINIKTLVFQKGVDYIRKILDKVA